MNLHSTFCKLLDLSADSALELPRASTGIYLALKNFGVTGKIIMPANICYSPIRASREAGYSLGFYNANKLIYDCNEIVNIANQDVEINAIIIPMLYGYYPENISSLKNLDKSRKWLIIEDLAQTFGPSNLPDLGHNIQIVTIYSFGQSKFIDQFRAGFVVSNDINAIRNITCLYKNLPELSENEETRIVDYTSALKIKARDSKNWFEYYQQLEKIDSRFFVRKQIFQNNSLLSSELVRNRKDLIYNNTSKFISMLEDLDYILLPNKKNYSRLHPTWRLTVRVNEKVRDMVVKRIREFGLPVSTWYDVVPNYLNLIHSNMFQESLNFSKEVINFWVDEECSDEYRDKIILVLKELEGKL